jgi:hypothetical protein
MSVLVFLPNLRVTPCEIRKTWDAAGRADCRIVVSEKYDQHAAAALRMGAAPEQLVGMLGSAGIVPTVQWLYHFVCGCILRLFRIIRSYVYSGKWSFVLHC